jgi:hypothetical protein
VTVADFLDRAIEVALKAHDGRTSSTASAWRFSFRVTKLELSLIFMKGRGWSLSKLDGA